jgi:hypothetical protein
MGRIGSRIASLPTTRIIQDESTRLSIQFVLVEEFGDAQGFYRFSSRMAEEEIETSSLEGRDN